MLLVRNYLLLYTLYLTGTVPVLWQAE